MSASRVILECFPSFCQKLSDLVEVWRSYNKNYFACFFLIMHSRLSVTLAPLRMTRKVNVTWNWKHRLSRWLNRSPSGTFSIVAGVCLPCSTCRLAVVLHCSLPSTFTRPQWNVLDKLFNRTYWVLCWLLVQTWQPADSLSGNVEYSGSAAVHFVSHVPLPSAVSDSNYLLANWTRKASWFIVFRVGGTVCRVWR